MTTVAVSGGFDPIHVGHIEMLLEAKALGDRLIVIVNNDNWLKAKKGFAFMPEQERLAIVKAIRYVDDAILTNHEEKPADMSVSRELAELKPNIFANGGDRKPDGDPVPEVAVCKNLGIQMVYNIGKSGKIQSSSALVKKATQNKA